MEDSPLLALAVCVGLFVLSMLPFILPKWSARIASAQAKNESGGSKSPVRNLLWFISDTVTSLMDYAGNMKLLLRQFALGIVFQILASCVFFVFVRSISANLTLYDAIWIYSLVSVIMMLPITLGGLGVREISVVTLLASFGIQAEQALAVSLAVFTTMLAGAGLGVIFHLQPEKTSIQ
jgi:uncharacterized membrane protein YbhN (UPF0104 family)